MVSVSVLVERVKNRKSIRWSTRHWMVWLERSKRTTQTELRPRNIEDEALLFVGIKACGSEIAYDPECCFDHGSLIRDKVYIHFKDASSKRSVRADQAEAPKTLGLPRSG